MIRHAISWMLTLVLLSLAVIAGTQHEYLHALLAIVAIIISFIPSIIKRNWHEHLPWTMELLLVLVMTLHIGGGALGFYTTFTWWDTLTHFLGSAIIALLGFLGTFALYESGRIHVTIRMMGVFTFFTAIAVGAIWEMAEFASDQLLGTDNQPDNADTNLDLITDTLSAGVVAVLGVWYLKHLPEARIERNVEKLLERLGRI
ncbi:hypothetical protein HY493_03725 [Candidatus Woesearchaeota archaeon]|nr:hypothetical protein [Candidatus Woesearchaeota archaeon]